MRNSLLSFVFLSICACTSSTSTTSEKEKDFVQSSDTTIHEISNSVIIPPESGIVNVTLKNGEGNYVIHKEEDQIIYLKFEADAQKELSAQVIPLDSNANIRFTQIILPNGVMDGPFGQDMSYKLPMTGEYQITLHENMMAGDPWKGEFVVKLHVENIEAHPE